MRRFQITIWSHSPPSPPWHPILFFWKLHSTLILKSAVNNLPSIYYFLPKQNQLFRVRGWHLSSRSHPRNGVKLHPSPPHLLYPGHLSKNNLCLQYYSPSEVASSHLCIQQSVPFSGSSSLYSANRWELGTTLTQCDLGILLGEENKELESACVTLCHSAVEWTGQRVLKLGWRNTWGLQRIHSCCCCYCCRLTCLNPFTC